MSRSRVEKVHCPNCDAENHILIWESLNTKLNPKETKQLLDGTFFVFECNQCNYKTLMDYAILYHDMENMCMIYYVGDDQIDKTKGIFEYAKKIGDPEYNKCYRHRIVTSQIALREKALIFNYGLDDRIIEIAKYLCYCLATEQHPQEHIEDVRFMVNSGQYEVCFLSEKPMYVTIDQRMLDYVCKEFATKFTKDDDRETIIDFNWAKEKVQKA